MMDEMNTGSPDWDFKERDKIILSELARNPQLSSREISELLEEKHDVDVSHVTVSQTIRRMRDEGVFREAIIPNETYYTFFLLEFKFNPENFAEGWKDAMTHIRYDEHTLFYSLSSGEYQWKTIMMFPKEEEVSKWIHQFYKEHGPVVENIRSTVMNNILKFRADSEIFEKISEKPE